MMSVLIEQSGALLADHRHAVQVALAAIGAAHRLEDPTGARLERQVDVLAHRGQLHVRVDHVLADVLGVRARVTDPLDALHGVHLGQQLGEGRLLAARQVAAVGADVLAEQGDLAHAVGGQPLHLGAQLRQRPRDLASAGGGHDAVGAGAVAAHRDLHPGLELARALHRQVAGEALELEVALGGQAVAREELGQLVHLAGAEGHVHERELLEHALLDRLRPAAAHAHHAGRVLGLEALGLAQVADDPVVRLLADRAGVEEDQVGAGALLHLARSRASRACPSSARSRARSSGTRRW